MAIAQIFEGTWEELAQYREHYGTHRLMLMVLPRNERQSQTEATQPQTPRRRFGSGKGLFRMSSDFDAPLEDFKEYME